MRGRKPNPQTVVAGPWPSAPPPTDIVEAPDWQLEFVDGEWGKRRAEIAQARWRQLVESMAQKSTLDRDNGALIEMAAGAYADWKLAEAHVATFGPVVPAPKTKVPMHNPFKAIADAAFKRVMAAERDLGIPPIERGRAGTVDHGKKAPNAASAYLGTG